MSLITEEEGVFHLRGQYSSYVFYVLNDGRVMHLYWGAGIREINLDSLISQFFRGDSFNGRNTDFDGMLDSFPSEYPTYGTSDFRTPAIEVENIDGSSIVDLRFQKYNIFKGKKKLVGLPGVYTESDNEAETLELTLIDNISKLEVVLSYSIFENSDVIIRSVKLNNKGKSNIKINRVLSTSVDLKENSMEMIQLSGSWARERRMFREKLLPGSRIIDSTRGESSHQQSPFIALVDKNTTEYEGRVYGFSFVYSGNFIAQADLDQFGTTRILMGINPFDFNWTLKPGESFQAPEVAMLFTGKGLHGLSSQYHNIYSKRLARGVFRDKERPILINNWEATYFTFNSKKIIEIASKASEAGIELFVLDDGWFGHRDSDNSSLGDWFSDTKKLPEGIAGLSDMVNKKGIKFGIWVEPEMISVDSELYKRNPDWCIHVPNRDRTEIRNQLVLDITREDVRNYIFDILFKLFSGSNISYVKWDMNRPLTEMGSSKLPAFRQREFIHRYNLGLYDLMDRVTTAFPNILFESCSGGGARFDAGMMYYMPQAWVSDNMDPLDRLKNQWSTSYVFPPIMMGAHVCSSPNHLSGRVTPLKTRAAVAMSGAFGYELDITKLSEDEVLEIKEQVEFFKLVRGVVQFGEFYRYLSPYENDAASWGFINVEKSEAFVMYTVTEREANQEIQTLKLYGLDLTADYLVIEGYEEGLKGRNGKGVVLGGDFLMNCGLRVPDSSCPLDSFVWRLFSI